CRTIRPIGPTHPHGMTLRSAPASHDDPPPFAGRLVLAWRAGSRWWRARWQRLAMAGRNEGPPDLDELWRDFNRRLGGLFGGMGGPRREEPNGGGGPSFQPDMKNAGIGVILIALVVAL